MSTGFAGGATRKFKSVEHEVESRLKRMDVFTDDFSPPGASEKFPGSDFTKRNAPYEDKHTDMAAAGNAREQPVLDEIDQQEHDFNAPLKPGHDQFPGALSAPKPPKQDPYGEDWPDKINFEAKSEVGAFDPHQTDPTRLRGDCDLKEFDKRVEARMKRMDAGFKPDSYGGESESKSMVNSTGEANNPDLYDQRNK